MQALDEVRDLQAAVKSRRTCVCKGILSNCAMYDLVEPMMSGWGLRIDAGVQGNIQHWVRKSEEELRTLREGTRV